MIDVFAKQSIPIATIDRTSGLIVASPMAMNERDGLVYADCGYGQNLLGDRANIPATRGEFNVLIRSMVAGTSVRVTARWSHISNEQFSITVNCETRNSWERNLEIAVKAAAESKKP